MADLVIVILNWNAASDTIRCVRDIDGWRRLRVNVIVVDNASADNSVEVIGRECREVHLIRNVINVGFAGGNNVGIEAALAMGDMPILLLNNDASITEEDVIRLIETLNSEGQLGFVGPLLYDAEDSDRLLAAGSKNPAQHHRSHNHVLPPHSGVSLVECVPGTAIMIRSEVFRRIGLLDEDYFFSSEIADLCLRGREEGYLSAVDTRARAFHTLGRSSKLRHKLYAYYIIRNRFLLVRKFHQKQKLFYYGVWTLYSLALAFKVQVSGNSAMARAIWLGLIDGVRGNFGNQNQRVLATEAVVAGKSEFAEI